MLADSVMYAVRQSGNSYDPAVLAYEAVRSDAVGGLVYHWAQYELAEPTHARVRRVAAVRNGRVQLLDSIRAWREMARPAPTWSDQRLVHACAEMTAIFSSRADIRFGPTLFRGTSTIDSRVMGPDEVLRAASLPRVLHSSARALVDAWFIEAGQIARYECRFEQDNASLRRIERIEGIGYVSLGS
jgi:hypothetical protein